MFVLKLLSGHYKGKTIQLPDREVIIGRERDCYIRLFSAEISRHHCRLKMSREGLTIEDLNSSNGTFLNGQQIAEATALKSGDCFKVGPAEFQVCSIKPTRRDPDSVDESEIANWLAEQREGSSTDLGTTVINAIQAATTAAAAAKPPSSHEMARVEPSSSTPIPKPNLRLEKVYQSLHEEAQDIIRRHLDLMEERAAEGDTKISS
ncbi:MAG: FHA domain-containing protein [Planctomycetales bacterium]